jgi:CBS domain-containing protein
MGALAQILHRRSAVLCTASPDQTVRDAARLLNEREIGAVLIVEGKSLVGIFTERDLLRRVVARNRSLDKTRLEEVMTRDPITATPAEDRENAIRKMQQVGCRHLPIMVGENVVDVVSIRDLLFHEIEEYEAEVLQLRSYISGSY